MSYDQKYDNRQPGSNNRNGQSHGNRQSGGNNRNGQRFGNRQNTENYRYKDYKELTNDNYVEYAKEVIDYLLNGGERKILTTSQIRNLLSLNSEIYNIVISESGKKLSSNVQSKLQYLKVRMVYDSGRDNKVKNFVMNAGLIKHLDEIGDSREKYMLFAKFMEALVAYRKFEGGRDE